MASQRAPLGISSAPNVRTVSAATTKAKTVSGTDKPKDDIIRIARLQQEVDGLRGRVARRDETIANLQAGKGSASSTKDLESQLAELVKRHEATKTKHRSELDALAARHASADQESDKHRSREAQLTAKLADVRAKLALSEAEARRTRDELAARPLPQAGPAIDERLAWRKEKTAMEAELLQAKKEADKWMDKCGRLESTSADVGLMRAENERLRYGWSVMAEQYGQLYEVLQDTIRDNTAKASEAARERVMLEEQLRLAGCAADNLQQENSDLHEQLDLARNEVDLLATTLHDAITSRQSDHGLSARDADLDGPMASLAPTVDESDIHAALSLVIGHADLGQSELLDSESYVLSLIHKIIDLEQAMRTTETALTTARNAMTLLRDEHDTLKGEHASCGPTISQLRYDAEQADRVIQRRGQEVQDVRLELQRVTRTSERQADMIKSSSEEVSRAKYAQDVLEEEVENLRTRYIEAAGYEEKYQDLLEQQALLETREAIAIEQAERVAMENAELMGHPDGSSRIGYVDGVRRELAMCRQELASTRHHLNTANDRIAALETEISAYKSISPESALGASRTRVVRRQPEGGRLTTSTSASGSRRVAVAGPGGAMRFV